MLTKVGKVVQDNRISVPELVVVLPDGNEHRIPIQSEVTLGREPGNTLTVDDGYLSRKHCKVIRRADRVSVMDMRSYNGTFVNGQRIHEECFLLPADVVRIGRTTLYVDWKDGDGSEEPRVHAPDQQPREGVEPIVKSKQTTISPVYKEVADAAPVSMKLAAGPAPPSSRANQTKTADGDERTMSYPRKDPLAGTSREQARDKKTPVPISLIEESAAARAAQDLSVSGGPRKPGSTVSKDREGLRVIAQIARVLPSVEDEAEFLDYALGKVLEVVQAERGVIMRLDPSKKGLYAACVRNALPGRDDKAARRLGVSHTIARKVVRDRVSVLVDDAKIDPRFKEASSIQELEVRSILCAPIWLGEKVSGLIYLDHLMHAYMFTEADRELVVAVANLMALGLQKASRPQS
jgi:hypothetical protein